MDPVFTLVAHILTYGSRILPLTRKHYFKEQFYQSIVCSHSFFLFTEYISEIYHYLKDRLHINAKEEHRVGGYQ